MLIPKALTLACAGALATSFAPAATVSPEALRMLDPTRLAGAICGGPGGGSVRFALAAAAAVTPAAGSKGAAIALYRDLARDRLTVTTRDSVARRYFNQGVVLTYGFNHAGAVRSFRMAQRRDPSCALCWWGEALALGPNINAPMEDRDRGAALTALDRAMALRSGAAPHERALIEALARRYSADPAADRAALDGAYAEAMLDVAHRFAADDEVAVLAAEAVMDTSPWNYWQADGKTPVGRSGEAVRLVDAVLARHPGHPQAAHLAIHLFEANQPKRAEAAADRLARAGVGSAGHLVHMPGHIYHRVGRYRDAIRVNVAAARADEAFIRATGDRGLVAYAYRPHNVHFIVTSAQMTGDMKTAIAEARRLRRLLDPATSAKIGWIQAIEAAPYQAMAQFARPVAILAIPAPDPRLPYAEAIWRYARAAARAEQRDRAGAEHELAALAVIGRAGRFAGLVAQGMPAPELAAMAELVARGRLAAAEGDWTGAAASYRAAIAIEGKLPYQEPAYWYAPVSQSLGAALFRAGRYDEASAAFRAALAQTPGNGWALWGLARSERAQRHFVEAAAAEAALRRIWQGDRALLRMERL